MIIVSFGAKHRTLEQAVRTVGLANRYVLSVDARKLPNPYSDPTLRNKTGLDREVKDWLWPKEAFQNSLSTLAKSVSAAANSYEGVFICCYGGKHRSVLLAEEFGQILEAAGNTVSVRHLELEK